MIYTHTWNDNKVRELTTVCFLWQQWTETSEWFNDIGTYQHFTAVLLLIYGNLFLSGIYYCLSVFWCAVVRILKLLVKFGKSVIKIRKMLVQVYRDNAMKKTAVISA
jgi:hypothetical protein